MFGFVDMVAMKGPVVVLFQITSRSNRSSRLQKISDSPIARSLIREGALVYLALFDLVKHKYRLEIVEVTPELIGEKREKCQSKSAIKKELRGWSVRSATT